MGIISKLNNKIVSKIEKLNMGRVITCYALLFFIGRIIRSFFHFRFAIIHQINLTIISCVVFYMLKELYCTANILENEFLAKNVLMYVEFKKLNQRIRSCWNIIIPLILCAIFVYVIFFLEYLPKNPMGIFGAVMSISSFFLALMAYYAFVNSIACIFKLQKIDTKDLPFLYPNDIKDIPEWIGKLKGLYRKAQVSIFTVGILFTLEYILLVPVDSVQWTPSFKINSKYPLMFMYNWIVIAIFVIIACPIMVYIARKNLNNLLNKVFLKAKKIIDLELDGEPLSIEKLLNYQQIIKNLQAPGMYIVSNRLLYPVVATSLSLLLNVVKLFESYLVPLFRDTI